jgi:hypothetical protein
MDWTAEAIAQFVVVLTQAIKQALPDTAWRDRVVPFIALALGVLISLGAALRYGSDWYVAIFIGLRAGAVAIGEWKLRPARPH